MPESILSSTTERDPSSHESISTKEISSFETNFTLELVGVKTGITQFPGEFDPLRSGNKENDRLLTSLFSSLRQGESLTFVYDGGNQQPFKWQIVGKATSSCSIADAEARLYNVRHAVMTAMESRKSSYCFDVVTGTKSFPSRWMGMIEPASTVVCKAPASMGFQSLDIHEHRPASISRLPHYVADRTHGFQSIASLLNASSMPIRIAITLEPCRLNSRQLNALQESINIIRNSNFTDHLPTHLEETANIWIKAQAGYRICCKTYTPHPIPESFLLMLGGEIYHGPVSVSCRKPKTSTLSATDSNTGMDLDLHDCIPASYSMPVLLPRPESLIEHGVTRFYNHTSPQLPKTGLLLGHIREGKQVQPVYLCPEERSRHLYILGATGTGKSTLLYNLISQDIRRGEGVCVIDPHGDLYREVLESIPVSRAKDVVLLDPTDRERAVGINLLEINGSNRDLQANFVINEFLKVVEKLYDLRVAGGPIFEQFFRNAMQLIMLSKKATLADLSIVFENPKVRASLVSMAGDTYLTDFWKMAEDVKGDHGLANMGPYITSKINLFAHSALIRPIIGQEKSTINFREIMDNRRILLVNLSRGILGELDSQLLGMVIITRLMGSAMERIDTPVHQRIPFRAYIDEFQNFTTDSSGALLSESRKFGISLTLANQNLNQLMNSYGKYNLIDSVLGNAGSMILFRLGAPDAEKMATYTKPSFLAEDLQNLANFHATARLLTAAGPTASFVFQTCPAKRQKFDPIVQKRIKKLQHRYSTSISVVEKELCKRREEIRTISNTDVSKGVSPVIKNGLIVKKKTDDVKKPDTLKPVVNVKWSGSEITGKP